MSISDYKRVPKSDPKYDQRWYVNTKTGRRISRWDYQKLQHGGLDPKMRSKIRKASRIPNAAQGRINALVTAYKEKTAKLLGIKKSKVRVRGQSDQAVEFRKAMKELNKLTAKQMADKSPDGKLAQILVKMNFRKPEWDMPVNESPRED